MVSTCSYEARVFGVRSAMPMTRALTLCPHADVVEPRMKRYAEVSSVIMEVFDRFSPLVEPLSIDEAFIDMSGATRIFGPPRQMAGSLRQAVKEATGGLTVSVGVASTKFVAKVASDMNKPDGVTVVAPDEVTGFLWPLPVSRIWGVGPKAQAQLESLGMRRIGDVAVRPRTELAQRFGVHGEQIWLLANGIDEREVEAEYEAKSVGREFTLEEDVRGRPAIIPHLLRSADAIARSLRRSNMTAGAVRVKLKTADFRLLTRQGGLPRPTSSAPELMAVALSLLDRFDLSCAFRLVGMTAFALAPLPPQEDLFLPAEVRRQRKLDGAVDRVLEKFGDGALWRGCDLPRGNGDDK